jgi:hypothetical protein
MTTKYERPVAKFRRIEPGVYDVKLRGTVYGRVFHVSLGVWRSVHRDGTVGPSGATRIDTAWAMLNA